MMRGKIIFGLMLSFLLVGTLTLVCNFKLAKGEWIGTVHIESDGSVYPPDAPVTTTDRITYMLTDNITSDEDGIIIERDGITIDGCGYKVQGLKTLDSVGIKIDYAHNVTVRNIQIENFYYGIDIDSSGVTISGVSIKNNHVGIFVYGSYNSISGNIISGNEYGIELSYSYYNNITENEIYGNEYGISLYESKSNLICGNHIEHNTVGIHLYSHSSANRIYHNYFVNNYNQARCRESVNYWDNGFPSGGNYWSDYTSRYPNAKEIDDSGIWDTPYVIDQYNKDNYPLVPEFSSITSLIGVLATTIIVAYMKISNKKIW